jgi:uncharacterized protein (TIGR02270 family)
MINALVENAAHDAIALWVSRDSIAHSPNSRLVHLSRFDERVQAHLDLLRTARLHWPDMMHDVLDQGMAGGYFVVAALAIQDARYSEFEQLAVRGGDTGRLPNTGSEAPFDPCRGLISAMAWTDSAKVTPLIDMLLSAPLSEFHILGLAALGSRRNVGAGCLETASQASSPLVRARAYRTTGQLGRYDLLSHLRPGLTDPDPECRFWSAWAAARMGAGEEALGVLAEIAWTNQPRAPRALELLLRRVEVPHANAWLREFAKLPDRQRDLIRATGVIGDPLYIPWLIEQMKTLETARLAGEAFSMITGLDLAYRDLDRQPPRDFESGPNDDPADENVALDEDEHLPWPDLDRIGAWWLANQARYQTGTPYFLGTPKPAANWLEALSDAFQRQRHAAALELAIRQPDKAMFEVRARGRLQRMLIARSRGLI